MFHGSNGFSTTCDLLGHMLGRAAEKRKLASERTRGKAHLDWEFEFRSGR